MALLLAARGADATVTVVHSRSEDIAERCREADIIVAAVGRPDMVQADWVKPGAAVVDVGINRVDDDSRERGWRLAGDVHPDVASVAGACENAGKTECGADSKETTEAFVVLWRCGQE